MFIKTTISELSCNKPWFSLGINADEYIFNIRYLSTIVEYNGGSRFFLINDYDRHGGDVRFTTPITVAEIIAEFDNDYVLDYLNVDYCKNDNPAKGIFNEDIPTDHIILLYPYHNPAYTWLIFDSYNKLKKILIVGTLDDIYNGLSGASATTPIGVIYYVSTTGSDSNSGFTQSDPLLTIEHALTLVDIGDTVALKKGDTWTVDNCISIAGKHGTASDPITVDGSLWGAGDNAIIQCNSAGGASPKWYGILQVVDSTYITVQNIEIDGGAYDDRSGIIVGGASGMYSATTQNSESNITIQGCNIHNIGDGTTYQMAILVQTWVNDMQDISIIDNIIDYVSNHGIAIYPGKTADGGTPSQILRPAIHGNNIQHYGLRNDGVHTGILLNNYTTDAVVEYNTCIPGTGGHGSAFAINCNEEIAGKIVTGVVVRYNDFRTNDEVNYQSITIQNNIGSLTSPFTGMFYYNKLYAGTTHANQGNCVFIYAYTDSTLDGANLKFYNNTMVSQGGFTFYQAAASTNILTLVNNIMFNNGSAGDYENLAFMGIAETVHSNNSYWKSTGALRMFCRVGATYYTGEETKSIWEASCQNEDPLLTDLGGYDWTLLAGSPCLNTGVNIPALPQYDYNNIGVADPPEIGSYELVTTPTPIPTTTPVPTTTPAGTAPTTTPIATTTTYHTTTSTTTTTSVTDLKTDLIAYWKLDDESGDAIDAHGSHDGTVGGSVYGGTGKIGDCYAFTATEGQGVTMETSNDFNLAGTMGSISAWFVTSVTAYSRGWIAGTKETYATLGYGMYIDSEDPVHFKTSVGNSTAEIAYTVDMAASASWHHAVMTWDVDGNLITYLDGTQVDSREITITPQDDTIFTIGHNADGSNRIVFNGSIDEVGIWGRVLTSDEVADLYNSGNGLSYNSF